MLIYGFDLNEKEKLDKIIKEAKLPSYITITQDMAKMKIRDIISGLKFQLINESIPNEKVIIFNDFNDDEINYAIKNLKKINLDIIMAVVTPTSIEWTFDYLIHHLIEEREWYRKKER